MSLSTATEVRNRKPAYSSSRAINEFHAMYASEIDFVLVGLWDGGIDWFLGNGYSANDMIDSANRNGLHGNSDDLEVVLTDMTNAARAAYPNSAFAFGRPTDISTPEPYRTIEELVQDVARAAGVDISIDYESARDRGAPDDMGYTISFADDRIGYGGVTIREALLEALAGVTGDA